MKVLAVEPGPHFSVADVHHGLVGGFRQLGVQVASLNLGERLDFYANARMKRGRRYRRAFSDEAAVHLASQSVLAACYQMQPDVVLFTSGFFIPLDLLDLIRSRGSRVVLWHTESPYEDDRQVERAEHADLNVLNDPTNLDRYPAGTYYQPHSYDPDRHCPGPAKPGFGSEFCFVGTGYPSRIQWLEAVDFTGVDVALAGNWQGLAEGSPLRKYLAHDITVCCDNSETVDLYRSTKVSLNLYRREANDDGLVDGWAMGPREVELAATGTFFLRHPRGEGDELLPMLPTVTDPAELGLALRWWLAHEDERVTAALAARAAVADRTFARAAGHLLRRLTA